MPQSNLLRTDIVATDSGDTRFRRFADYLDWFWHLFEVTLGILICWVFAFGAALVPLFTASGFVDPHSGAISPRQTAATLATLLVSPFIVYIQINFFQATWNAIGKPSALQTELCQNTPRVWLIVRPVVAAWWLGHVALCLCIAASLDYTKPTTHIVAHKNLIDGLLAILTGLAFSLAANIFLLQTVAVFTPKEAALHRTWKLRLLIDSGVLLFPLLWHLRPSASR